MQVHDKGKGPAPQMSEMSQAYMASLEIELTDLVLGMEAEVAKKATVSVASAQKLRRLRLEAERLFGAFPDEEV